MRTTRLLTFVLLAWGATAAIYAERGSHRTAGGRWRQAHLRRRAEATFHRSPVHRLFTKCRAVHEPAGEGRRGASAGSAVGKQEHRLLCQRVGAQRCLQALLLRRRPREGRIRCAWRPPGTACIGSGADRTVRARRQQRQQYRLPRHRHSAAYRGVGETIVLRSPRQAGSAIQDDCLQGLARSEDRGALLPHLARRPCTTVGPRVLDICPDTANQAAWDRQRGKYVAYIRIWNPPHMVGRVEVDDILRPWPYKSLARRHIAFGARRALRCRAGSFPLPLATTALDPTASDHYNAAAVEYLTQNAYVAFPSSYMHFPEPPVGKYGNDGLLDIQLAVSRDGVKYHRVSRAPYIPLGLTGEPDSLSNYMAVGMVRTSDYLLQYYGPTAVTTACRRRIRKYPSAASRRSVSDWTASSRPTWPGAAASWSLRRWYSRASGCC